MAGREDRKNTSTLQTFAFSLIIGAHRLLIDSPYKRKDTSDSAPATEADGNAGCWKIMFRKTESVGQTLPREYSLPIKKRGELVPHIFRSNTFVLLGEGQ